MQDDPIAIIDGLKKFAAFHLKEAERLMTEVSEHKAKAALYQRMLEVYETAGHELVTEVRKAFVTTDKATHQVPQKTFEDVILEILSDEHPLTTNMLAHEYRVRTGKLYSNKDMSAKLAIRSKKHNKIKNIAIKEFPIDRRYWWGKAEWFDGENLKEDYKNKIMGKNLAELFAE